MQPHSHLSFLPSPAFLHDWEATRHVHHAAIERIARELRSLHGTVCEDPDCACVREFLPVTPDEACDSLPSPLEGRDWRWVGSLVLWAVAALCFAYAVWRWL